jgi:hypothetical protein
LTNKGRTLNVQLMDGLNEFSKDAGKIGGDMGE